MARVEAGRLPKMIPLFGERRPSSKSKMKSRGRWKDWVRCLGEDMEVLATKQEGLVGQPLLRNRAGRELFVV